MYEWPKVVYKEEGMREGMQIEDASISVDDKIELLDALSETGLSRIVVGSFVSPKWTPQMERIDEIVTRFNPNPDVTYTALALNSRGVERARAPKAVCEHTARQFDVTNKPMGGREWPALLRKLDALDRSYRD